MSKRRDVILAVKALVATALPGADIKGFDRETSLEIRPGAGGTVVGFPGDPEETGVDLSPATYHYNHAIALQLLPPAGAADPAAALDAMGGAIGAAVKANVRLGGLVDYLQASPLNERDETPPNSATTRYAELAVIADYSTEDPLN